MHNKEPLHCQLVSDAKFTDRPIDEIFAGIEQYVFTKLTGDSNVKVSKRKLRNMSNRCKKKMHLPPYTTLCYDIDIKVLRTVTPEDYPSYNETDHNSILCAYILDVGKQYNMYGVVCYGEADLDEFTVTADYGPYDCVTRQHNSLLAYVAALNASSFLKVTGYRCVDGYITDTDDNCVKYDYLSSK